MPGTTVLIIDDDQAVIASLALLLKQHGFQPLGAAGPGEALAVLDRQPVSLILQDMNFSRATTGEEGLDLLVRIQDRWPTVPVLLMTAWGNIDLAVAGMKAGAVDFLTKPWSNDRLIQAVRTALDLAAAPVPAATAPAPTREDLDADLDLSGVVGADPGLCRILSLVGRVAPTDASILITGDSGTGKEVLAEAIHRNSRRAHGPFVKVNLGGIAPTLFESEMFGHVRGAFTDAHRDREGRFTRAHGGTIFLDEIGELDPRCQVKLLRVLQDRAFEVLGSSETCTVDVRVIAATNRDLGTAVQAGTFREDLFYRLNLITMALPPLADRRDDIPRLAAHFTARAATAYGVDLAALAGDAIAWLQRQPWPGNVRQLKHLVERTLLVAGGDVLTANDFSRTTSMEDPGRASGGDELPAVGSMTLDDLERGMILKSLEHHAGNISRAAEVLGLSRAALYRRIEKYGIKP